MQELRLQRLVALGKGVTDGRTCRSCLCRETIYSGSNQPSCCSQGTPRAGTPSWRTGQFTPMKLSGCSSRMNDPLSTSSFQASSGSPAISLERPRHLPSPPHCCLHPLCWQLWGFTEITFTFSIPERLSLSPSAEDAA